jgi:calcineurin-like phosphoesterase family protein
MLTSGKSVLLSAPMGSRIAALVCDTASQLAKDQNYNVIFLDLMYLSDGALDMQRIWDQISKVLGPKRKNIVETPTDLGILLYLYIHRRKEDTRFVLMVTGVRSGSVRYVYELLVALHSQQVSLKKENKFLQFLIYDHFSLRFYIKRNLSLEESELYLLEQVETPVFEESEIIEGLSSIKDVVKANFDIKMVGKNLFEATGGHYSLLMLTIEHLLTMEFKADEAFWRNDVNRIFESSDIVKKLRQTLVEDREGIVETAIKYTEGLLHEDFQSPRTIKLRTLGVLHVTLDYRLKLCGGFIRKLIEAVREEKYSEENALGTYQTFSGLSSYEGDELKVTDGDLLFLHISDLHVGEEHAFKIHKTGRRSVGDRGTVAEFIQKDLERLGFAGRVDGLLVSGDLTCLAEPGEFARAEEVICEIADVAGVPAGKIALVPGNHDIQWRPDEFAKKHGITGAVSRENFDRFYRNVIGHSPEFPEIRRFTTRDKSETVDLVCLDSNYVEGLDAAGIGMIEPNSLSAIGSKLAALAPNEEQPRRAVWFISHHHYLPVCDVEVINASERKVSVMANASHVLNIARDLDVEVILHGHQHQPFLCYASRWMGSMETKKFRPVLIVGAGSVAAKREHLGPIAQNHYFLLIRQKDRLVIRSRKLGEEGLSFTPHDDFVFARPQDPH